MDLSRRSILLASTAGTGAAVALAACGADTATDAGPASDASGSGIVTTNGSEPVRPLLPTDTTEGGGGGPMLGLFSCLVYYDEKGAPHNEVADSIESEDNIHWTIKLSDGWTFTNGDAVTAQSFVDAWNFGANAANAQLTAFFFEPIDGYEDVSAEGAAADATMRGLKVVDDLTFTVDLVSAQSDFPLRLGYNAYAPMPSAAFDDIQAFGESPIGNGPYKMDGDDAWQHNKSIALTTNPDYAGQRTPRNGGITYVQYQDPDTAYNDLMSGNLDICDQVPESAFSTFREDLGDRYIDQPGATVHMISIYLDNPRFSGEAGRYRRQAFSRAIDRESIAKAIFDGTVEPAKDFTAPVLATYTEDIPGNDVLVYDEAAAKELWAKAEAIEPFGSDPFIIQYDADGGRKGWVDAVCSSLSNVLGISANGEGVPDFKTLKEITRSGKAKGGYTSRWGADYPSAYNFLANLFGSGAADGNGANLVGYKNPDFDDLLATAQSTPVDDSDTISSLYVEAQSMLMNDLPNIPMWYGSTTAGYSDTVSDVVFAWDSYCQLYSVTK